MSYGPDGLDVAITASGRGHIAEIAFPWHPGTRTVDVPQPVQDGIQAELEAHGYWSRDLCSGYPAEYGDSVILVPPEAAELK